MRTANATTESRAGAQTQKQKDAQELAKARTFEDLSRSSTLAAGAKEKGVKQVQVDLADFIQNQGFETEREKQQLEQQRLGAVGQEQSNQGRLLVNQFLAGISDPARYQAAVNAYGNIF